MEQDDKQEWENIVEDFADPNLRIDCLFLESKNLFLMKFPYEMKDEFKTLLKNNRLKTKWDPDFKAWEIKEKNFLMVRDKIIDLFYEIIGKPKPNRIEETKNPYCITQLLKGSHVSQNSKTTSYFVIAKELYITMGQTWLEIEENLRNHTTNIIQTKTLKVIRDSIENLPIEQKGHSCATLLKHSFIKNTCNLNKCNFVSGDFPQNLKSKYDMEEIYEKLHEIEFIRLPQEYNDDQYSYFLKFSEKLFDIEKNIKLSSKELNFPKDFYWKFRDEFLMSFEIVGETNQDKQERWTELVDHWMQNMKTPYKDEHAGTILGLQEDFLTFMDLIKRYYYTFDVGKDYSYPLEDSIYFLPDRKTVYVPLSLVRKYVKEKNFNHRIADLRFYLREIITGNSFNQKIVNKSVRLWGLHYTETNFPELTTAYQVRLKLLNEGENEE